MTARMLERLEPIMAGIRPDLVVVLGDTNSTLAGALAAAQATVPLVHIEAGMRSGDRAMPEELNRVLTDRIGALLLCASQTATENLRAEAVAGDGFRGDGGFVREALILGELEDHGGEQRGIFEGGRADGEHGRETQIGREPVKTIGDLRESTLRISPMR